MTDLQKHTAEVEDQAHEFAKQKKDGADMAEFVAREVKDSRQRMDAAINDAAYFHTSVEDLSDVEKEVRKKDKYDSLGSHTQKVQSTEWKDVWKVKNSHRCIRCHKRSIYERVPDYCAGYMWMQSCEVKKHKLTWDDQFLVV